MFAGDLLTTALVLVVGAFFGLDRQIEEALQGQQRNHEAQGIETFPSTYQDHDKNHCAGNG